jgi:hypothetical protein
MKRHRFPFGKEPAPPLSEQRSTIPMDPAPAQVPEPIATMATAPLSMSRVRVYATEPLPPGLRRPVLPFRAAVQEPLREDEEQEQELSPEVRPEGRRKTRTWSLVIAIACVVAMLLVTAVQVAVELRSVPPATSARIPPLPSAMPAPSVSSSAPIATPAQPSAPPAVSLAPVLPRAPAPRKRPSPRGEIVDPWGSEP